MKMFKFIKSSLLIFNLLIISFWVVQGAEEKILTIFHDQKIIKNQQVLEY